MLNRNVRDAGYLFKFDRGALAKLRQEGNEAIIMGSTAYKDQSVSQQLMKDIGRAFFKINGKSLPAELSEDQFKQYLLEAKFTEANIQLLFQHYSQDPTYMMNTPFKRVTNLEMAGIEPDDQSVNIMQADDGKIYYETKRSNFALKFLNRDYKTVNWGPLRTKTRSLHVLTDTGFELVEVATNNRLIADLLIGGVNKNVVYEKLKAFIESSEKECAFIEKEMRSYKKDLRREIEKTLRKKAPSAHLAYQNRVADQPGFQIKRFDIDAVVDHPEPGVKKLEADDKQFRLALTKYRVVRDIYNSVKPQDEPQPGKIQLRCDQQLDNCYEKYVTHKKTIEAVRASGVTGFLQSIAAKLRLWKSKGKAILEKLESSCSALRQYSLLRTKKIKLKNQPEQLIAPTGLGRSFIQ